MSCLQNHPTQHQQQQQQRQVGGARYYVDDADWMSHSQLVPSAIYMNQHELTIAGRYTSRSTCNFMDPTANGNTTAAFITESVGGKCNLGVRPSVCSIGDHLGRVYHLGMKPADWANSVLHPSGVAKSSTSFATVKARMPPLSVGRQQYYVIPYGKLVPLAASSYFTYLMRMRR